MPHLVYNIPFFCVAKFGGCCQSPEEGREREQIWLPKLGGRIWTTKDDQKRRKEKRRQNLVFHLSNHVLLYALLTAQHRISWLPSFESQAIKVKRSSCQVVQIVISYHLVTFPWVTSPSSSLWLDTECYLCRWTGSPLNPIPVPGTRSQERCFQPLLLLFFANNFGCHLHLLPLRSSALKTHSLPTKQTWSKARQEWKISLCSLNP